MASIDLSGLTIDQLTDLVGKAQTEMASREKQRRKDLSSELERRGSPRTVTSLPISSRSLGTAPRTGASAGRCRRSSGTRRTRTRPGPGSGGRRSECR